MANAFVCALSLIWVRPVVRGAPRQVRCSVLLSVVLSRLRLTFRLTVSRRTFVRLSLTSKILHEATVAAVCTRL